jgi:hypothetical protein
LISVHACVVSWVGAAAANEATKANATSVRRQIFAIVI